jgi:hypothetical protein
VGTIEPNERDCHRIGKQEWKMDSRGEEEDQTRIHFLEA